MNKLLLFLATLAVMAVTGTAGATLVPSVYDPDATGCPVASYAGGVLHLEKNCATATNAAAQADITGLTGQTFTSATFTLASDTQCNGGSPRFDIVTGGGTFFLGCNNVIPTANADGTFTYLFDAATIAAAGNQVPFPTGAILSADVLVDVEGEADLSEIAINGIVQVPAPPSVGPNAKADCKKGGWKTFTDPSFKNQGRCVSYVNHRALAKSKRAEKHGTKAEQRGKHSDRSSKKAERRGKDGGGSQAGKPAQGVGADETDDDDHDDEDENSAKQPKAGKDNGSGKRQK